MAKAFHFNVELPSSISAYLASTTESCRLIPEATDTVSVWTVSSEQHFLEGYRDASKGLDSIDNGDSILLVLAIVVLSFELTSTLILRMVELY